ncbi:MAG: YetF domain-containing protein [Candidatus Wallacebacter cryptica]|jgi:uncharacterized membrane protein YcaP (DUF421 family)
MNFWQGQHTTLSVWAWILRAVVMFFWLLLISKLMGQRLVGRLTLMDFVISITIGSIAANPLANKTDNLIGPMTTIAVLGLMHIIITYIGLLNPHLRRVVQDEPIILVKDGQILYEMLRKTRFNIDDLMFELRIKNYPNPHDIEFAILEPNGQISIIPKSQFRPITPSDLGIATEYEGMPTVLVEDGNIVEDNLRENHLTETWVLEQLKTNQIQDLRDVTLMALDTKGRIYISQKNQSAKT